LQSIRDRFGNQITITRSSGTLGNITQITSPNGRWIQFTYDFSNRITQAKDNTGRTVNYTYDAGGRLWKVTDPADGVTEYTYDTANRMLTLKDARSNVYLTNEYNSAGRVTKQTQADNSTYQIAYTLDTNGNVTRADVTDPRGNIDRVTFNADGYTLSETRALGTPEQQTRSYSRQAGTNLISSVTDSLSRTTSFAYDAMGNLASVTRLSGTSEAVTTTMTHEPGFNEVASVTDPLNHTTAFGYDPRGNLTSINDPLNHQTTLTYNAAGQPLGVTDALQHAVQFSYDSGDLVGITDPLGRTVTRAFDALGRPITVTNALGQQARDEYNKLDQTIQNRDPLQGVTAFAYDANGNLLSVTDARNGVISHVYNNMDRPTSRRDPLLHDETYQYDLNGNLTQRTDRKGQLTLRSYDALNRLTQVTYSDTSTISYTRDGANRITQVVDSVSGTSTLAYDNLDRLTSITTPQGTVSYTYDSAGRRVSMTVAGQLAVNYTYDNANRPTQMAQGSVTVTIAYDNAGRRTSLTLPNGVVTEYEYNAASQVTGITYRKGGAVLGNLTYAYDGAGRRSTIGGSYARTGLPLAVASSTYNAANQQVAFGGQNLTYDLNGNLTSDGTNTYSWNGRDQLVSMAGPGLTASFQYDALGRRISKTVNGSTFTYLYDGSNLVQEKSGGLPTANLLAGALDEVFIRTETTGTWSPLVDGIGSTLALTDATGAIQTEYTYESFGRTTVSGSSNNNASQYTGRENDATGLYYYRGRYYSPSLQRFISEDPIGLLGGINLFAYVDNNPVSYRDPFGFDKDGDDIVDALKDFVREVKKFIRDTVIPGAAMEPVGPILDTLPLTRACFVAGTKVKTASGDKPIEEVRSGDVVISIYPEKGEHASAQQQTVTSTFVRNAPVVLDIRIGQTIISATPEHPFWVIGKGWKAAGQLRPGTQLLTKGGNVAEVDKVERREGSFAVYNFEVVGSHTYYVSPLGILVHNQCNPTKLDPLKGMKPDQRALKELVDETTLGGRKPLSVDDANTILDWAKEINYPGARVNPGCVACPLTWTGGPHFHIPGAGRGGHIPVQPGLGPRP
ncbi:MAG: RHS repeat-associated core domain-containing protein, partial [Pyrinomonadaceae bacterium]